MITRSVAGNVNLCKVPEPDCEELLREVSPLGDGGVVVVGGGDGGVRREVALGGAGAGLKEKEQGFFLPSRVLGFPVHHPFQGPLTHLCDLEAGYGGVWVPNFLVGRHRDLNPGPPA